MGSDSSAQEKRTLSIPTVSGTVCESTEVVGKVSNTSNGNLSDCSVLRTLPRTLGPSDVAVACAVSESLSIPSVKSVNLQRSL